MLRRSGKNEKALLRDIRDVLSKGRRGAAFIAWATLLLTFVTVVVGIWQLIVSSRIEENVDALSELGAQEVVDRLQLEMTESDLRALLQVQPEIDESVDNSSSLDAGLQFRRQVYLLPTKYLTIMVLIDDRQLVRLIAVTSLDGSQRLRYPLGAPGGYAGMFQTNFTTLPELAGACLDGANGFGSGASWGYLALGCKPKGVNNSGTNIVAVNMRGPGAQQSGLVDGVDLTAFGSTGELPDSDASVTFNTFAWLDYNFLFGTLGQDSGFEEFVEFFEMGPWRPDPIPTFTPPVAPAPQP